MSIVPASWSILNLVHYVESDFLKILFYFNSLKRCLFFIHCLLMKYFYGPNLAHLLIFYLHGVIEYFKDVIKI